MSVHLTCITLGNTVLSKWSSKVGFETSLLKTSSSLSYIKEKHEMVGNEVRAEKSGHFLKSLAWKITTLSYGIIDEHMNWFIIDNNFVTEGLGRHYFGQWHDSALNVKTGISDTSIFIYQCKISKGHSFKADWLNPKLWYHVFKETSWLVFLFFRGCVN